MRAYEKKKHFAQFCARQLRAGLTSNPSDGNWGKWATLPDSTSHNLKHGCHPYKLRAGK